MPPPRAGSGLLNSWTERFPRELRVSLPPLDILYEDNHCLAIVKPAGTLSTHFQGEEETLDRAVKAYLKEQVHRSRATSSSASSIGSTGRSPACCCSPAPARRPPACSSSSARAPSRRSTGRSSRARSGDTAGTLEDWLLKDREPRPGRGGRAAHAEGAAGAAALPAPAGHGGLTWLEVRPQTGRHAPARVSTGPPRPPDLRRRQVRRRPHLRPGHRPARPQPDLPAPDPLRADHADRRGAAALARAASPTCSGRPR